METGDFNFKSVHEYMDTLFKDREPSEAEIAHAKKAYWKLYLKAYKKRYRDSNVQIAFYISKSDYAKYKQLAKTKDMKVTSLLRQLALQPKSFDGNVLKQPIMELIDLVEEAIYENTKIDKDLLLDGLKTLLIHLE